MTTKYPLYFIAAWDGDGENLDLFVSAGSERKALDVYDAFWAPNTPDGPVRVFEVPTQCLEENVQRWHDEVIESATARYSGGKRRSFRQVVRARTAQ